MKWLKKHLLHPSFRFHKKKILKNLFLFFLSAGVIFSSCILIWVSTLPLPDLNTFEQRKVAESTKIYDKTGTILLYDVHQDIKRTLVPFENISQNIKNATIAIEDDEFYEHHGVRPIAFLRAVISNIFSLSYSQGGSTITQQVIKNSILTKEKSATRKLKEWILALKLERSLDKNSILNIYLNESPYGGNIYGVEQAAQEYFGKTSKDVTLAEAAYLAAIPQAPTFYSPFGKNKARLDDRKNLVLKQMYSLGMIQENDYTNAKKEVVTFRRSEEKGIKAPHFVFYIKDYLEKKYGDSAIEANGYKVITTLDYSLQQKAEEIVRRHALINEKELDAENASLVALDPKTGQILVMVGSRDYFDKKIDGNYNVATGKRQPGSTFKPFAYATAFLKGYTPDTMLFDVKTEFSTECSASSTPLKPDAKCYTPKNFDSKYRGPMSMRNALAQSINIPAIKTLYLAGTTDTLRLAKEMGLTSLNESNQYGLTMVLGGAEVGLLEMTGAYGVFANQGLKNSPVGILEVRDKNNTVVEKYEKNETRVLDEDVALTISDVLSDNQARGPSFGYNSPLYFPGRDVAAKTGTTNDYHDAWIVGYTPSLVVGAWAGNNNNRPIKKEGIARPVITPMWNEFMHVILPTVPNESFPRPAPRDTKNLKPVMKGFWQGGESYYINKTNGQLATEYTPEELKEERVVQSVHDILYWVNPDDPLGPKPVDPTKESQFERWETPVRQWAKDNGYNDQDPKTVIPTQIDDVHRPEFAPKITVVSPALNTGLKSASPTTITFTTTGKYSVVKAEFFLNSSYLGETTFTPFHFTFVPNDAESIAHKAVNNLKIVVTDAVGNKGDVTVPITITD